MSTSVFELEDGNYKVNSERASLDLSVQMSKAASLKRIADALCGLFDEMARGNQHLSNLSENILRMRMG